MDVIVVAKNELGSLRNEQDVPNGVKKNKISLRDGMQTDGTKKRYMIISGRRFGKILLQQQMIAEAEANGEWVAIADKNGIYCSRCRKHIYQCRRKCITPIQ